MTHAYNAIYLDKVSRTVGNMLHYAVREVKMDGDLFLDRFIQSGIAEQIEAGNPKYAAGKSGIELFSDVMEMTGQPCDVKSVPVYDRSDVYWVGWILAQYQWYSGWSFRAILDVVPHSELLGLYGTLHEADVQKSYDVLDAHMAGEKSRLKSIRKKRGMTQRQLAEESGVPLSTIRAYEQKKKDLGKAQYDVVLRISRVLRCEMGELFG